MGRIGVVGGSKEYTGAPYFAAISALRLGADLCHVFCPTHAAFVIKTYSPELIVHPLLYESHEQAELEESEMAKKADTNVAAWFSRLDSLVIGPGLGQDTLNSLCAKKILISARISNLPLVLDADALYLVTKEKELIEGYTQAILTPNINELRRLGNMLNVSTGSLTAEDNESRETIAVEIAQRLKGPIIVSKGQFDVITNGHFFVRCTEESSNRRCGGQGDILSGTISLFAYWCKKASEGVIEAPSLPLLLIAAYGGCLITRRAARLTFVEEDRSMLSGDVIKRIGRVLDF